MRYFLRKSAFYIFTAWAAITINFFLPRMLKGDPVTAYIQQHQGEISPDAAESLRVLFGLDEHKTLFQQYCDYWVMLFHGNLGSCFALDHWAGGYCYHHLVHHRYLTGRLDWMEAR